ncbi:MAG: hypothetical protein AAF371_00325 [Pseudomonadota bacterium]
MRFVLLLALLYAGPAAAAWQHSVAVRGGSAVAASGGVTVRIACIAENASLYVTVSGGPFAGMRSVDDGSGSMTLRIAMGNGEVHTYPIDGHYDAADGAFVARWLTNGAILDRFAQGATLTLTAPGGERVVEMDMTGTSRARQGFRRGCGL